MRKSSVFAICFLTLLPAAYSQAEVVVSSRPDVMSDSLLVYTGRNESGNQEIAPRSNLSASDLIEMQKKFSEQSRSFTELERTVDDLKRENSSLKSSNDSLSRKVDDMQRTLSQMERSISDLSSKIK